MGRINAAALISVALLVAIQGAVATTAAAQSGDERSRALHAAALNQLGVLEYCHAQGMVDEAVVSAQREMIRRSFHSPAPSSVASPEEEFGRAGFLAFGERQGRFLESALAQGLTLKTACEVRAASVPAAGSR